MKKNRIYSSLFLRSEFQVSLECSPYNINWKKKGRTLDILL